MSQNNLAINGVNLILKKNLLALISDSPLKAVSSAIHNGGELKDTQIIINAQVTDEYGDLALHNDPNAFILKCFDELNIGSNNIVGLVTYANVADYALVSKTDGKISVSVIATAGCTHSEHAGENIQIQEIAGTINIIVLIDANPTDSCLVSSIITATEAKTAALMDLDVRSKYSGQEATGTITDALVVAGNCRGESITYGGPASHLGQLVAYCTKKAVKEAVIKSKIGGYIPCRSLYKRLTERHLSVEKIASELYKINKLPFDKKSIEALIKKFLADPFYAFLLFSVIKMNEDFEKGLIPNELSDIDLIRNKLNAITLKNNTKNFEISELTKVNLPPLLTQVLINLLQDANSE